jgi:hypothetical protein
MKSNCCIITRVAKRATENTAAATARPAVGTKGGPELHTFADARFYILDLPETEQAEQRWQHAAHRVRQRLPAIASDWSREIPRSESVVSCATFDGRPDASCCAKLATPAASTRHARARTRSVYVQQAGSKMNPGETPRGSVHTDRSGRKGTSSDRCPVVHLIGLITQAISPARAYENDPPIGRACRRVSLLLHIRALVYFVAITRTERLRC